ncbi:putative TPR-repeat-containing protein [Megalodesulfovibrio gigas DSM 1382 = ATCC 19364]|uniref:Putative TPR-repeat-containing protein n=1 Tax=Megalodesulfovibrio gigas (strain ATCC 19364 / DSM 1382 / NCIMB 9332 / VKM B-1759) TaxID=1121448 RepID=T2G8T5_MEGG1|nr:putative TPR-repeat-containing protein [Megalodesulfovibrio gigas DSM 1382 = ATCC 19364]
MYAAFSLAPWQFPYQINLFGNIMLDEALHFLAFAMLAVGLPYQFASWLDLGLAVLVLVLLGVATELAQLFIPSRAFALQDMAANILGCLAGVLPGMAHRMVRARRCR